MTTPVALKIGMSMADFIHQFDQQPFELINGEIFPVPPSVFGPIYIANQLSKLMDRQVEPLGLGKTFLEATFVLTSDPTWVTGSRIPDMIYITAQNLADYQATHPNWRNEPMQLIPDIALEVMSPNDTFAKTRDKALLYLQDGVPLVWIIDPDRRVLYVFTSENQQGQPFTEGDTLTANSIIPDLSIEVSQIFV